MPAVDQLARVSSKSAKRTSNEIVVLHIHAGRASQVLLVNDLTEICDSSRRRVTAVTVIMRIGRLYFAIKSILILYKIIIQAHSQDFLQGGGRGAQALYGGHHLLPPSPPPSWGIYPPEQTR